MQYLLPGRCRATLRLPVHIAYRPSVYAFKWFGILKPLAPDHIAVCIDKPPFFLVAHTGHTIYKALLVATSQETNKSHGNTILRGDDQLTGGIDKSPFFPHFYRCQSIETEDFSIGVLGLDHPFALGVYVTPLLVKVYRRQPPAERPCLIKLGSDYPFALGVDKTHFAIFTGVGKCLPFQERPYFSHSFYRPEHAIGCDEAIHIVFFGHSNTVTCNINLVIFRC